MAFFSDDISINTLIGPGSTVSGNLRVAGFLRIDGDIDGDVETTGRIIIGENARIRGNIIATSIIVGGVVEGDIVAPDGVDLFSTSIVLGDVITRKIKIATNCLLHGKCIALKDPDLFAKAMKNWQDSKAIIAKAFLSTAGIH